MNGLENGYWERLQRKTMETKEGVSGLGQIERKLEIVIAR